MSATDFDSLQPKAVLVRRDRTPWTFTYSPVYRTWVRRTRSNVYAILGEPVSKPFWVARRQGLIWLTAEAELRADRIEFDNGGVYIFPK